jgi:hypothetical protein
MQYNINNYFNIDTNIDNNIDNNTDTNIDNNIDTILNNVLHPTYNIDNIILKKKKLIEISKNLSKIEYFEIFNIIKQDNCQYSENKNGIFINLSNVMENTIDKIFNFIDFIKHKKEDLIKHEEIINNAKKNIIDTNKDIEINKNIEFVEKDSEISDSDNENNIKSSNYLIFSSDEDEDLENKLSLKKKKIKYTGKKAKMIKSIKDSTNDNNKNKNRNKKNNE